MLNNVFAVPMYNFKQHMYTYVYGVNDHNSPPHCAMMDGTKMETDKAR